MLGAEFFQEPGAAASAAAEIKEGLASDIAEQLCYGIEAYPGRPENARRPRSRETLAVRQLAWPDGFLLTAGREGYTLAPWMSMS